MTFQEYLNSLSINKSAFIRKHGLVESTFYKVWTNRPVKLITAIKYHRLTNGSVPLEEFLSPEEKEELK